MLLLLKARVFQVDSIKFHDVDNPTRFIYWCLWERLCLQCWVLQVRNDRIAKTEQRNLRELIRNSLKCDLDESLNAEELEQCHVENVQNWWYGCLGDYCGATLPEGVCAEKCIPPLEEGIALCDGKISKNGMDRILSPIRPVIPASSSTTSHTKTWPRPYSDSL